jgi:copper transport protein
VRLSCPWAGDPVRRLPAAAVLLLFLIGTLLLQGLLTSPPASAHATVESTTPADGARLQTAPRQVTIHFDEDVSLGAGYARVIIAPGGQRADTGAARQANGTVTIPLRSGLPEASYVVTWRVVSADSHPVSGAISFVVGNGELVPATSTSTATTADPVVSVALPVARWSGYLGLALGIGVPVFLLLCWPGGWRAPLLRRLSGGGLVAVAVSAVLLVLLQGPYAAGAGLGSLLDPKLLSTTTGSTFGATLLLRPVLALVTALVLLPRWRSGAAPGPAGALAVAVPAVALVLTVAGVGHPVAGSLPVLEVAVAAVHVAGMVVWLGGLAAVCAALLRTDASATEVLAVLARWSRLAFGVVCAILITGVLQAVREVGSTSALVHTDYGWLLIAKVAVVLLVLAVALLSRDWVRQQLGRGTGGRRRRPVLAQAFAATGGGPAAAGSTPASVPQVDKEPADDGPADEFAADLPPVRLLRRWVLGELVGATVVLVLSAVLVGLPPAQAAVARPVDVTLPLLSAGGAQGNGSVQVLLEPARPGGNSAHLYVYDAQGRPRQPQQITASLSERQQQIGPLALTLALAGAGHYTADPQIPTAGTWTLTVTVRLDEFTALTASTTFPVR